MLFESSFVCLSISQGVTAVGAARRSRASIGISQMPAFAVEAEV